MMPPLAEPRRALVLEDLPESGEWLRDTLTQAFPGISIEIHPTLADARAASSKHAFDLALIDLALPDGEGADFIAEIRYKSPDTICVVATVFADDLHLLPALRAGAHGYLLKDQPQAEVVELLCDILRGYPPLAPAIARKILAGFQVPPEHANPQASLTEREREVLTLLSKGMNNTEIATLLGISAKTVPSYVQAVYRKLHVSSRAEAAVVAKSLGMA